MSVKVIIKDNGPIRIEGEVTLFDQNGIQHDLGEKKAFSLCRCGASKNKPFCDGEHGRCGFQSSFVAKKA